VSDEADMPTLRVPGCAALDAAAAFERYDAWRIDGTVWNPDRRYGSNAIGIRTTADRDTMSKKSILYTCIRSLLGKFAFGDRATPIHARTQGSACLPKAMGVYYAVQSAVMHTNKTPLSKKHRSG
jgi:hypothetical protein